MVPMAPFATPPAFNDAASVGLPAAVPLPLFRSPYDARQYARERRAVAHRDLRAMPTRGPDEYGRGNPLLPSHIVNMTDRTPPPYELVVRACTIYAGRNRWDIRQSGTPVQSSMESFASAQEAHKAGSMTTTRGWTPARKQGFSDLGRDTGGLGWR